MAINGSPRFAIRALSGERLGEIVPVVGRIELGRAPTCEVQLLETGISRAHAAIIDEGGTPVLMDLLSTNGTYVGEQRITRHELHEGDRFRIASSEFAYEAYRGQVAEHDRPAVSGRDTWEATRLAASSEEVVVGPRDGSLRDAKTYPGNLFRDIATFREISAQVERGAPPTVVQAHTRMAMRLGATAHGQGERRGYARFACDYPAQVAFDRARTQCIKANLIEIAVEGAKVSLPHERAAGQPCWLIVPVVSATGLRSIVFESQIVWAGPGELGIVFVAVSPFEAVDEVITGDDTAPISLFDRLRRR
jgi:hypothetical protein